MIPESLGLRIEMLINDLMEDGGVASASMASILLAAQDSVEHDYCLELSRRAWIASNALRPRPGDGEWEAGAFEGRLASTPRVAGRRIRRHT
jgi:hypothetical protein